MQEKPLKLNAILYAGTIIALVSSIPFLNLINCFCCAGIIGGGVLGVWFYKNDFTEEMLQFDKNDCVVVGVLTGVCGGVMSAILSVAIKLVFGDVVSQYIIDFLYNLNLPSETFDEINKQLNQEVSVTDFIVSIFSSTILFSIFGLIGGFIGWGIFKPKNNTTFIN